MRHMKAWVVVVVLLVSLGLAQTKKAAKAAGGGPDKALMQKVWDGWSTLDVSKVSELYASGARVFFDITPLKYASWDEYQKGVVNALADLQKATFAVNHEEE